MRPRNEAARAQLRTALSRRAAVPASALVEATGVSVPTLHRLLRELGDEVVSAGRAQRARYALRRAVRGDAQPLPLYEIGRDGRARALTRLVPLRPAGTWMPLADVGWPVPDEARDGWWPGLPYPLYDMRPQGYIGRQLARARHREFGVPLDPEAWTDDDVMHVLSRVGADCSGSLVLGDAALERWQAERQAQREPLAARSVARAYAKLADDAVAAGVPGSSAAGEFPKFSASREPGAGGDTPHVLVKFSGAEESSAVRRWSDLLVCEHLALECTAGLPGVQAARSRIVGAGGRTFLEVERFDRHGAHGRSRLASLAVIEASLLGDAGTDWTQLALRLQSMRLLTPDDVRRVELLWCFGRLIANTDMHLGNLSFRPVDGVLRLAPAYDMVPMLYAPLAGGEVPARSFEPALPLPAQRDSWLEACRAALDFWQRAARDSRITEGFRRVCADNARRLLRAAEIV